MTKQSWKNNVRFDLEDLDRYTDTAGEKADFNLRFKPFFVVFVASAAVNMMLLIFGVHEAITWGILVLSILGLYVGVLYANTRVTCKKCGAPMTRHLYTNGKDYHHDGEVYVCHNCETKFIALKPSPIE